MNIHFATCNRRDALRFLQAASPDQGIDDTPESAGPLLDLVERDIVRVQDPEMHGVAGVIPSTHWDDQHLDAVHEAGRLLGAIE